MLIDYISNFENALSLCNRFERFIIAMFFSEGKTQESSDPFLCQSQEYIEYFKPIEACIGLCRIIKPHFPTWESIFYESAAHLEISQVVRDLNYFKLYIVGLKNGFETIKDEVSVFCSAFDEEEKTRINEAIHNHFEGCNYSCVAMSVSAVESRLLKLMCLVSPESERELEKKTLGQLIFEYINHKDKYNVIVPKRHDHLLQLCNTYRTFSVHPKKHKLDGMVTDSIFNLTIVFLTDQDTKPGVVQAKLLSTSEEGK